MSHPKINVLFLKYAFNGFNQKLAKIIFMQTYSSAKNNGHMTVCFLKIASSKTAIRFRQIANENSG